MAKKRKPMAMPAKYLAILDAVSERDREWFEAHPLATEVWRPYVPGEFYPYADAKGDAIVHVRQLAPGIRVRRPWIPEDAKTPGS